MTTRADTLVRLAKHAVFPLNSATKVIGGDDFALRRGKTYGTIIVDLIPHRPVALLPERTAETLSHWLMEHSGAEFISRDRSSEYMRGATEGAPDAEQVLDRWHVLEPRARGRPTNCESGSCRSQTATERLWSSHPSPLQEATEQ